MIEIEDIPTLLDQRQRIEELTVDCYGQLEELSGFGVYLTDAMQFPFEATWRDPDEPDTRKRSPCSASPMSTIDAASCFKFGAVM